jgi:hypothetical protein
MANRRKRRQDDGTKIIPYKRTNLVIFVFGGILALLVMVALILLSTKITFDNPGLMITLTVLSGVVGVAMLAAFFFMLILKERLVLDGRCLQLRQGGTKVVGQVPLANIAALELVERFILVDEDDDRSRGDLALQITLIDRKDPDTWWPSMKRKGGPHIEIADDYERDLTSLRTLIVDRIRASQAGRSANPG